MKKIWKSNITGEILFLLGVILLWQILYMIAVCVNPNHKIENGTQQILGSVCIPMIRGLKFLCKNEK